MATFGALRRGGIYVEFDIRVGADNRADIPSIKNRTLGGETALKGKERFAGFRVNGDT